MLAIRRMRGSRAAPAAFTALLLSALVLAGCGAIAKRQLSEPMLPPVLNPVTELNQGLRNLPPPSQKVVVAVYNYADQTGQFKPAESVQTLSKAVTQGATSVIIKALQDVGNGSWFTVVEREKLDNLLKERRIIQEMRKTYLGEENVNPKALPPLLFAGILLEGGIIGYDSNLQTGGIGARLLGIGGDVKYQLDTITIYLRAVSTKNGQVLSSVVTHKTVASVALRAGVFKYIAVDEILEGEAGFTKNEPEQFAVQQSIEKAVHALVIQGTEEGIWSFADKAYQARAIADYRSELLASAPAVKARASAVEMSAAPSQQPVASASAANAAPSAAPAVATAASPPPQTQSASAPAKTVEANPAPGGFTTELITMLARRKSAQQQEPLLEGQN